MARYPEKRRAALEATMKSEVHRVATAILREEGLGALTMDRIAREIGVSRGTLYNYFADADSVLNFVDARTFGPIADKTEQIAAGPGAPKEKLAAIAGTVLDALYQDRALAMALFAKKELCGPRAELKRSHRKHFLDIVEKVIALGASQGCFRELQPRFAAELFLGAMSGLIDSMMYGGELRSADELVPGLMDVMLSGLEPRSGSSG